jgi:micrococcal nuclease
VISTIVLLALSLVGVQPARPTITQALSARTYLVTRVVDGDTIVLEQIGTVRLIGVDTPETVDPRRPVQRFGKEASDFAHRLLNGKRVRVEYDWNRKDKYNRTLAYVYLEDGTLVNSEIIRQGYGVAYTRYPFKFLSEFRAVERQAREQNRGLWAPTSTKSIPIKPEAGRKSPDSIIVYVTRTGTKYHQATCRLISSGSVSMSLSEAVKKYEPCAICKPPVR